MKATDLRIGDWVRGRKWRELPFKLTRINSGGKFYHGITAEGSKVGPFFIEELEPIPLTPEILEKNGWHYDDIDGEWYGCGLNLGGYNPEEYIILDGRRIRYVNELQHFLSDCKIDKEIVL